MKIYYAFLAGITGCLAITMFFKGEIFLGIVDTFASVMFLVSALREAT